MRIVNIYKLVVNYAKLALDFCKLGYQTDKDIPKSLETKDCKTI